MQKCGLVILLYENNTRMHALGVSLSLTLSQTHTHTHTHFCERITNISVCPESSKVHDLNAREPFKGGGETGSMYVQS